MPIFPMYCPECDKKHEVIGTYKKYQEVKKTAACPSCSTKDEPVLFRPDFSKEARNTYAPVVDFKPHYSYALGKHVDTKREMFNEAAKMNVKLNRAY